MVNLGFHEENSRTSNCYHLLNIGIVRSTLSTLFYLIYTAPYYKHFSKLI